MTGTLTVFGVAPDLSTITTMINDPGYQTFVDSASAPTFRLRFVEPSAPSDPYNGFVVLSGDGSTPLMMGDYSVARIYFETVFFNPAAAFDLLVANLTTVVAVSPATSLTTLKSRLNLIGHDAGVEFHIAHPQTTVQAGLGGDKIIGSPHGDSIYAGGGNDTIIGGGAGDTIVAGFGDDEISITDGTANGSIDGGDGVDTLILGDAPVAANIYAASASIRFLDLDPFFPNTLSEWTVAGVEYFRGSAGIERFYGDGSGLRFEGGAGSDQFYRDSGDDFVDIADYSGEMGTSGIVVNFGPDLSPLDPSLEPSLAAALGLFVASGDTMLGGGYVRDTYGDLDTLAPGYIVAGTSRADFYYGSSGADVFRASGGDDHIFGGDGNDVIDGGEGIDVFYLALARSAYSFSYSGGVLTIVGADGTDTVSGVEMFSFAGAPYALASFEPQPPVAEDDSNGSDLVVESAGGAGDASASGNVRSNDHDPSSAVPDVTGARAQGGSSFTAVTTLTSIDGTYGSLTISADGTWTYTLKDVLVATNALKAGETAHDTFVYQIGTGTLSDTATLDIAIAGSNDAPTSLDKSVTIDEDGSYGFSSSDFAFADVDSGDTLRSITIKSLPTGGALTLNGATVAAGQSIAVGLLSQLTFAPAVNASGSMSFGFTVSDGSLNSAGKTFTISVTAVNDAPTANNDMQVVGPYLEDQPITFLPDALLGNDTDPDAGPTLSIVSVGGAQHGSVAIVAGNVVFTPDANYAGAASFTYVASDGTLTSNNATVSLNILPMPDAPDTANKTIVVAEDTSFTFAASDFAFSDVDVGDTLQAVEFTSLPSNGTLTLGRFAVTAGQSIGASLLSQLTFTSAANANGSPLTFFTFKVSDGTLTSSAKTMTINVTASNDTPTANDDSGLATNEDTALTLSAASLLGNDSDADDDALTIASVSSGTGGAAILNGDGTVTFTPDGDVSGPVTFTYRAKDGSGAPSGPATVTIDVTAVNDAPEFAAIGPNAMLTPAEGTLLVYAPISFDVDSSTLTYDLEGADADDFIFDGKTLRFAAAPDYEAPRDSDGNNTYDVILVVSDGDLSDRQALAVSVLDTAGNRIAGTKKGDTIDRDHKIGSLGATAEEDIIAGKGGGDTINAAAGNDTVRGGAGQDVLDGGAGRDTVDYSDMKVAVVLTLNGKKQVTAMVGGGADDTLKNFENVTGGKAGDTLKGDRGGNDLDGGKGSDTLDGAAGNDTLTGGAGKDVFVFDTKLGATVDIITDFTHDAELLQLDAAIFKAIGMKLDSKEFYAAAGAVAGHDKNDRIIYDTATGDLYYDADGKKAGIAIHFATLSSKPPFDAGDIVIV